MYIIIKCAKHFPNAQRLCTAKFKSKSVDTDLSLEKNIIKKFMLDKKLKRNPIAIENMKLHHRLKMHNLLAPPGAFISFFWKVWWDSWLRLENSIFVTPFRRIIKDQTENIGTATWWWLKTTTTASVIVTQSRRERRDTWWRNSSNYNIIFV